MQDSGEIKKLIDAVNSRGMNSKNYEDMGIEEVGEQLREAMRFEQDTLERIKELERMRQSPDLVQYAKIICRDTTRREVARIQEIYLKKIDRQNSVKS